MKGNINKDNPPKIITINVDANTSTNPGQIIFSLFELWVLER